MAILHLGLKLACSNLLLRGSFTGPETRAEKLRLSVIAAAKTMDAEHVYEELGEIGAEHGFVIEAWPMKSGVVEFHFSEPEGGSGEAPGD